MKRFVLLLIVSLLVAGASGQTRKVQNRPYIDQRIWHYGFLAGILVMCAGFSTRKRASRRVAETISAAGGTLSACCFLMILGCGYLSTLL